MLDFQKNIAKRKLRRLKILLENYKKSFKCKSAAEINANHNYVDFKVNFMNIS